MNCYSIGRARGNFRNRREQYIEQIAELAGASRQVALFER